MSSGGYGGTYTAREATPAPVPPLGAGAGGSGPHGPARLPVDGYTTAIFVPTLLSKPVPPRA